LRLFPDGVNRLVKSVCPIKTAKRPSVVCKGRLKLSAIAKLASTSCSVKLAVTTNPCAGSCEEAPDPRSVAGEVIASDIITRTCPRNRKLRCNEDFRNMLSMVVEKMQSGAESVCIGRHTDSAARAFGWIGLSNVLVERGARLASQPLLASRAKTGRHRVK